MHQSLKTPLRTIIALKLLLISQVAFALGTPNPSVQGMTISWAQIDATTINVHLGDGQWLLSLPGNTTSWQAQSSGDYFLVAADASHWSNWNRSQHVSVNVGNQLGDQVDNSAINDGSRPMAPENFRVTVYSDTALELFWNHASDRQSAAVSYSIKQNGAFISQGNTGSSLFVEGLTPGQPVVFEIEAVSSSSASSEAVELVVFENASSNNTSMTSTPAPSNSLSSPTNVAVSVYSNTSAELFWGRSASASDLLIEYDVFINNEPVARIDGASYFVDNLVSGTDYAFRVEAIAGALRSASATVSTTTPGAFRATPMGRPIEDSTTHGFGFWDNMTFEQQQTWPSDCLFAGNQFSSITFGGVPHVCFSPFKRELFFPARFRFSLPGDNETNHVEAIEWVSALQIVLVTDITTEFASSKYEISLFEQSGSFVYTTSILTSITNPSGVSTVRGINLDGKDIREIRDAGIRFVLNPNIYVIGEYYEPNGTGNANDISGWNNLGSFAVKINTRDGSVISEVFFPGRSQESITSDDFVDFGVSFF